MSDLIFFKCQQFNLLFGFFFAALGEANFSYGQESDLTQNEINISPASLCASEDLPLLLVCECVCMIQCTLPVYLG